MSSRANPTAVGAFVLGAVVLAIGAVLLLGSGRLLEERIAFVLYFDEAVTGLSPGAPVNFQGVQVGNVTRVSAVLDYTRGDVLIPVYVELEPGRVEVRGQVSRAVEVVQREIDRGLRARLRIDNFLTGLLYVDLDYYPDKPIQLKGYDLDTPEIPTIPTQLEELRNTLAPVMDKLASLPLEQMVQDMSSGMSALVDLVRKPELAHAIEEIDATFTAARTTLERIDGRIDPIAGSAQAAFDDARAALETIDQTLSGVNEILAPESRVRAQLLTALEEVERAARSTRVLADALKQEPDAIIFGRGGN